MKISRSFKSSFAIAGLLGAIIASPSAMAQFIYGNNAGGGPDIVNKINVGTGANVQTFNVSPGNGRGVVLVGNVLYTTATNDNHIYKTDATTGLSLGSITVGGGVTSMSTIAWDGSSFWTSDYAGTNRAFQINTSGAVIKTINLSLAGANYDGMEWFNGKLIANRGDANGPYDIYDLNGNVLQANFINAGSGSTGIAFDGTNFFTSNVFSNSLSVWNGTTGAFIKTINLTGGSFLIEDLSFDYAARIDTNPGLGGNAPDGGSTALLLAAGLGGMGFMARRRKRVA